MARLFSRRGVKSTIITTPLNALLFSHKIKRDAEQGLRIQTHIIDFPFAEAGLPEGCENVNAKPDCIVADLFFPWATQSAHSLGIPRLFFNGTSSFAICLMHCFTRQQPWKGVESDSEPFVMPGLPHRSTLEKAERGKTAAIDGHECLRWLDCREPNSVLYICFGSMSDIPASGQGFIWVVKRDSEEEKDQEWLPEGFEERMEGKGLVIKGWAPQVLILDHEEGVAAGVPMVTWPLGAEQFLNGRLVTDVDRKMVVGREEIERAVSEVMVGEDAEEMRERAMELKVKAVKANEEGGSSYSDLKSLLEELVSVRDNKDVDLSSCKL
ncbi:UDP-glycosyltransferase 73B3 [Linum grandiflorum]